MENFTKVSVWTSDSLNSCKKVADDTLYLKRKCFFIKFKVRLTFLICERVAPMVLGVGDWSLFQGCNHDWMLVTDWTIFATKISETAISFPFRNFLWFSISHNKFVYGFQIFFIDFGSSIRFIWTLFLKYFWTWDKIKRRWKWISPRVFHVF